MNNMHHDSLQKWHIGVKNLESFDSDAYRNGYLDGGVVYKELQISSDHDESIVKLQHTFPIIVDTRGRINSPPIMSSYQSPERHEDHHLHMQSKGRAGLEGSESR